MFKSILGITVVNVGIFIILFFLFVFVGFSMGLASNNNHIQATWLLYGTFVSAHFIINLLVVTKPKKQPLAIIIYSCFLICILHGAIVYIYC